MIALRKVTLIILPGYGLRSEYSISQLYLFDGVLSDWSQHETLGRWATNINIDEAFGCVPRSSLNAQRVTGLSMRTQHDFPKLPIADYTIIVLLLFGIIHLILCPYRSSASNIMETVTLLLLLPFQTYVASLT